MSTQLLSTIKKSSLDEILVNSETNTTIFKEYIPKEELGKKIFRELNKRYNKEKGFIMQDGSRDIGILSQCHCLQTLMSLAQDFGLDFTVPDYFAGQKGTIREIMDDVIEKIIDSVVRNENGKEEFVFDASPYDTDHFTEEYSNIDTITWVITTFLLVLKYHANKDVREVCKWEPILIKVIQKGMDYINDKAFIPGVEGTKGLDTGWNFTKDCPEPSLYFTFTVCECYLDIYTTFEDFLKYLHMERDARDYGVAVDPKQKKLFLDQARKYEENRNKEVGVRQARHDEYNEMVRIYRLINEIDDYQAPNINEDTRYGKFEKQVKEVARKVWDHVHENLADSFFYNNLTDTLTEGDLRIATTSDALFNTVYIVNIMVCAGLDETLDLERKQALLKNDELTARKKELEYNNLLESCLLAVQKAFRTYEALQNDSKEYIVDQFLVGFNEKFGDHPVAINELRKLRMRCFSLLPLLIHTNNVVSEYLVKYPQHNMRKYLEKILDNRLKTKDGGHSWIWESDGYFSGSNYYYVLALNEFYLYYEEFEHKYIRIGEENTGREAEIKAQYLQTLRAPGGELFKLDEELEKKDKKLAAQAQEIAELKAMAHPVEDALRDMVAEEMKKNLPAMMGEVFTQAAKVLTANFVDPAKDVKGVYNGLNESVRDMFIAALLRDYTKTINHGIKTAESYIALRDLVDEDLDKVAKSYVGNVKTMENNESELRKLLQPKVGK